MDDNSDDVGDPMLPGHDNNEDSLQENSLEQDGSESGSDEEVEMDGIQLNGMQPYRRLSLSGIIREVMLEDASDNDSHSDAERPENITFDQHLPTAHSYLGEMDDCSGIQYIDQESFVVLPILRVDDFVLVPGQTMPLDVKAPRDVSLLQAVMDREDKTFGVALLRYHATIDTRRTYLAQYGCTAELRSIREEEVNGMQSIVGIALGRQRFEIMELRPQVNGSVFAKVKILNDADLLPPASGARLGVHKKLAGIRGNFSGHRRYDKAILSAGWLTGNPPWVYRMYDVNCLRKWIIDELKGWYPDLDEKKLPSSPSAFSFWIASHSLMTTNMRLKVLKLDSSVQRLRYEHQILKQVHLLFAVCICVECENEITHRNHIFNMSVSGPVNAYVNPSGHIHETLTVYSAKGLRNVSEPSEEHSWFPGYAWTICQCATCWCHIGWKFTATKDSLVPKTFWGLTRSALSLRMNNVGDDSEVEDSMPSSSTDTSRGSSTSS